MVPADSARISRVPAYSGAVLSAMLSFAYGAITLCGAPFQKLPLNIMADAPTVLQPRPCRNRAGLGCCAFARHYLRNRFCFLFLRVMRCFSSRVRLRLRRMPRITRRVAPFGNPCLCGYLPLNTAYRSLSRPSSPPRAKASFMCPFLLSVFFVADETSGVAFQPLPVGRGRFCGI